jgi:large subunit ribosomal protein L24
MIFKIKLKVHDEVYVITGRDKGKTGKVLKIIPTENKALVSGINMVTKHQKADRSGAGGLVKKESLIDISNLALLDPKLKVPTKVGYKITDQGQGKKSGEKSAKVRFAKKSQEILLENKE